MRSQFDLTGNADFATTQLFTMFGQFAPKWQMGGASPMSDGAFDKSLFLLG